MDVTQVTEIRSGMLARARQRLPHRWSPPSLRAQLALTVSAFVCGGVVTGFLFVGIWRHTAAQGDRAQATLAGTRQQLARTQRRLSRLEALLVSERSALARVQTQRAGLANRLGRLQRATGRVGARLPGQLQAITSSAGSLAHSSATLASELSALQSYVQNPSAAGIDAGFLSSQIGYLSASLEKAKAVTAQLQDQVAAAESAATALARAR
jgi:chromosome segregation ATPase